jgi:riboflavin biosynthesis pyrimidine reductase
VRVDAIRKGLVARVLLEQGLLDELKLWIHPRFVGRGGRLLREGDDGNKIKMNLVSTKTLGTGVVVVTYQAPGA